MSCRLSVEVSGGGGRLLPERSDALARRPAGWTEGAHRPAEPRRPRRALSRSTLAARDGPTADAMFGRISTPRIRMPPGPLTRRTGQETRARLRDEHT